jgi:hypothetical protein
MGAWDISVFDNDIALDFLAELEEGEPLEVLSGAVDLPADAYIDDDAGSRALAAAAIIAAAKDRDVAAVPESVRSHVEALPKPLPLGLLAGAHKAVAQIMKSSETLELRTELPPEEFKVWKSQVEQLLKRLS